MEHKMKRVVGLEELQGQQRMREKSTTYLKFHHSSITTRTTQENHKVSVNFLTLEYKE
jgi:hypothetical protein